jgi:hypothetical protein
MQFSPQVRLNTSAFAIYALFAFMLLYPLWFNNGTHVAGYDYFNYNWNFWWIRHAFTTPGLSIYENNFVMFPALSNYGYHALTAFWYPLWALLEPLLGTLTAVNIIITLGCILNGFLLYLWLRSERIALPLALLGGLVLQTLPLSRYWYYNTHLNLMDWFWLPALLLLWKSIVAAAQQGRALSATLWSITFGVSLWGLLLTDLQFPIFALFVVAPYGVWTLLRVAVTRTDGKLHLRLRPLARLIACGIVSVGVGGVLMWFAGPLRYIARFSGELIPGPVEDRPGIPFPQGFLSMSDQWWLWDHPSLGAFFALSLLLTIAVALLNRRNPSFSSRPTQFIRPQSALHPLALTRQRRELGGEGSVTFWLLIALPPLILSLGPALTIGEARLPLPFVWMYDLTNGNFRMPWRLAPAGVIAGVTFMGIVWTTLLPRLRAPRAAFRLGFVATLLLMGSSVRLFETAPLQPVLPAYTLYENMGREPYEYVVLEAPTGMGTGELLLGNSRAIQYQWYGMTHEKRMINGFISRTPLDNFFYIETGDPLLSWLGQRRYLEPDLVEAELRDRIFNDPIGYIVIHIDDIGATSSAVGEIIGYFNALDDLLCPPIVEGAAVAYRTRWHPDGCASRTPPQVDDGAYKIDIGAPDDARFIGWGWHYAEPVGGINWRWAGAYPQISGAGLPADGFMRASLYLDLPPADYDMQFAVQMYYAMRVIRIAVNGVELADSFSAAPDFMGDFTVPIPADLLGDGSHVEITFVYDSAQSPQELGLGDDTRRLSFALDWVRFRPVGQGEG